ncbi:PREDICTED: uncharacterized protein LOC106741027 [Dinoponera quadriceps]|uniref:Uncharacterized protein LOC106741027 n=1 Tax=Dinoponera quadriceps TaxID=609295 RepID=A0A6P3WQM2_DINQU|nr:PREDICTED: uncharacterized protein LOC106741027 [Dinoponera quadriceps]
MYEKIALIVLALLAVAHSEEVPPTRTEVKDADFSDSRLSKILPLPPSLCNDQHLTKAGASRKSISLLTPLSQMRFVQRRPRESMRKTKRNGAHLRKSRLSSSSAKDLAKTGTNDSNVNVHVETSKDIPYVSTRNAKYSSENFATTSRMEMKTRDENKTLLRALRDSLKDTQDVDYSEETKRCNTFVCYCKEQDCERKSSRTSSSRILGSSRRVKSGRVSHRIPAGQENAGRILDSSVPRPGSPTWYHEPRVLGLINSVPMRPHQAMTHPAFFAPLLHGVPLVPPQIIGKDGKTINAAFPYAPFEGRPDFTVGANVQHQRRPIYRQDSQECRYLSEENRFDAITVSTASAWTSNTEAMVTLNEESITRDFSTPHETITVNYLDGLVNPVAENNVALKDTAESTEISEETLPRLSATVSTDHVASVTEANDNFEPYSSSGTFRMVGQELPTFITTSESYVNVRTDSSTGNNLNPYYSETTADRSESSTDLFRETTLSWTDRPNLGKENNVDQRMDDFASTGTESYEYTRPPLTEFNRYVGTTERTYEPNDDAPYSGGKSSDMTGKRMPMKKLTKQTIDEIEEDTRGELLGKSKSHATKMLLGSNYEEESITVNSPAGEKFFYSTISYESNEHANEFATTDATRGNSWTSTLPCSRGVYGEETTTPYYDFRTDRDFKEGTTNILTESIAESYPQRTTLQDQLTTTQHSAREETNDDDEEGLDSTESLVAITDSSVRRRLPFCDKSLLLSSIRRVINNFVSSGDLTKTQGLDEVALQTSGKSLLPEILQIPNLRDILLSSRIEDTIVQKVKGVLSNIANRDLPHGVIRKALRNLMGFHGDHHERKLPPMTVEEHQFGHGQWYTKLVTLAPIHGKDSGKLSMTPGRLREGIRDLLGIPAIASQANQQIVRNMILQSLRNSLGNKAEDEGDGPKIGDSVILEALNDALQALRGSLNPKVESVNDEGDTDVSQEMSTCYEGDYKTEGKQFEKNTQIDGTQATSYQKAKKPDDNLQVSITAEPPDFVRPGKLREEEGTSPIANVFEGKTIISSTDAEALREGTENVLNSMLTTGRVEVQRSNEEARNGESLERTTTYQQPSKIYILQETAGREKNIYTTEGTARGSVLGETKHVERYDETEEPPGTTVSASLRKSSQSSFSNSEISSFTAVTKWNEVPFESNLGSKFLIADEASEKTLAATAVTPNSMSSSTDGETRIDTTAFYNVSHLDEENVVETTQDNAMNRMEECCPKYDGMDPSMMRATNNIDAPPINYYSPNDRILDYTKNHRVDNEDRPATTAIVNSMRKSSSDYARLSDDVTLKNTAAAANAKNKIQYVLNEGVSSPSEKTAKIASADADSLTSQQREFQTGDVIKIHEVTTEVQKTHAKTVYFQPRAFSPEDDSRTNSPAIVHEVTNVAGSDDNFSGNSTINDSNNDSSDKKIDNVDNVVTEANKNIVSATGLPSDDVSNTLQLFPSSEESIAQLQRSQLYYVNDGVKLPLEVRRLKDGTYGLSISKDICEQILKINCCVPLQGHVVQTSRPDTRGNDAEEEYQSAIQPSSSTTTRRNTLWKLEEEAEEELNMHRLLNSRWKRDLMEDDSMAILSMPVLDFARKYNLSLDFNEEEMALSELRSRERIRNIGDSLKQLAEESEHNQLKGNDLDSYSGRELERDGLQNKEEGKIDGLQDSANNRDKYILGENIENLTEARLRKSHANESRSRKVKTSRLYKLEGENDNQRSVNVRQIMGTGNQARNSISKGTDIFEGETKFEMKWGDFEIFVKKRGEIPEEMKLIKLNKYKENRQHVDNNEENKPKLSEIKVLKDMKGRPYRYQRNTNDGPNKGTEVVKIFLHWLKSLFLSTNES